MALWHACSAECVVKSFEKQGITLLVWSVLVLLLSAPFYVHGRTVEVNWTLDGVLAYSSPSNPLRTNLGDTLNLHCDDTHSNLFIQTEEIQFNQCNASAGSGMYAFNGFCTAEGVIIMLTLTENSQNLMNTVNFENDRLYYFASYSTGQLEDIAKEAINSGGQCEDGLKMVVQIGEIPTAPAQQYTIAAATGGNSPSDPGGVPIIVIIGAAAAAVGGGALLIILVIVCIGVYLCCYCISKKKKMDVETVDGAKPRALKSSTITPVSSSTYNEEISKVNGKNPAVNGKKNDNSLIETKKPHKQDEVPQGKQGSASNKRNEKLTTPKPKVDTTAKTNGRNTVNTTTTQAQIGPSKAIRNGTMQNRTGAASSPSQNKTSRGDKTTVHKGTVQSAAKSSGADRDKPAAAPSRRAPSPPSNAGKRDRVQARSSLPPPKSLPPSSAPMKHERIQVKSSLPSLVEKTCRDLSRTQKSTDAVSYKTRNNAVNI